MNYNGSVKKETVSFLGRGYMRWDAVTQKETIKLIKEKTNVVDVYNVSMNKVKTKQTAQPPEWAKELIQTVSRIEIKVDALEVKVDNNTKMIMKNHSMIKTAHPELF